MKLVRVFHYLCMDSFMNEIKSVAAKNQNKDVHVQSLCPTTTIQSPTIVLSLLTMTRVYSVFIFIKRTTKSADLVQTRARGTTASAVQQLPTTSHRCFIRLLDRSRNPPPPTLSSNPRISIVVAFGSQKYSVNLFKQFFRALIKTNGSLLLCTKFANNKLAVQLFANSLW